MKSLFPEFKKEEKDQQWFENKILIQKKMFLDEIKHIWVDDCIHLQNFYLKTFELINLCLLLDKIEDNNNESEYTFTDFFYCLRSFLIIYQTFCLQNNEFSEQNEPKSPFLKRILTYAPMEEEEELNSNLLSKQYSNISFKNNQFVIQDLYEIIKSKFLNLAIKTMDHNKQFCKFVQSLDYKKLTMNQKFSIIKYLSQVWQKKYSTDWVEMNIDLERDQMWLNTYKKLIELIPVNLVQRKFEIKFKDEPGVDAGGPSREFYSQVFKDLLDPQKGFFSVSSNGITMQPSINSCIIPDYLLHFQLAGRLLAKSILDGYTCEVDLTKSFMKQLLQQNLYINDLEDIDPDMARGLQDILQNNVESLCLDFTFTFNQFGKTKVVELIPNGSNIEVTEENKKQYVKELAYFRMVKQIEKQVEAFKKGFYEVIPFDHLKILSVRELGIKLSGVHIIDIEDMKKNVICEGKYTSKSPQIQWMFEILEEYNQEQRAGFLFFATSSFKVPFGGFQNFQITISNKKLDKQSLPISHTCFKEIELPEYESKEIMKEKFQIALTEGQKGFYIR
ncbi:ubiquitin- hect domain protein, putative [Ichthyophthirius multifiliis]|uniref:HECT-type E3 ubiquitin transferase n=1 Tax=Ichthyophthirius multifiliis TaxID=5932 RepID=G0QVK9_ICHMU|nr:ubiquitin- hect domain protein, putative [Ichthyophthirius multifiliis]EGR30732.1 ubiquitin- hect domain protein, putative [Ichthyophthirius multifiliis]|eukprot:XP_004032319.1 ubiquitin- hect domain protein, putative [Ichthyophthirius multifiliis]